MSHTLPPSRSEPAGRRQSLRGDLREISCDFIQFRELLVQLTLRDLRVRYKQVAMGIGWAIVTPLIVVLAGWMFSLAFSRMAGGSPSAEAMAGLAVKSVGWAFFTGALTFGPMSLTISIVLMTKVYFPRELLPLAAVFTQLIDAAIAIAALCILLPFFGVSLSYGLLWLPFLAAILVMLTTAAVLFLGCLNIFFRDVKYVVQLVTSFGIFFTPVFFPVDAFGATVAKLLMLNPLAAVLEGMRLAVVHGHNLARPFYSATSGIAVWEPWHLLYVSAFAVVALVMSAVVFHRSELAFAEYV
jgi:ABC-type polysaccharide/polyol phosphate export permease